ncbi:MAG: hypothetical protein U0527_03895 [Candidatus Eisenbacteria bacterium]
MPPDAPSPVYFIATLRVRDVERYRSEYGRRVLPLLAAVGAKARDRARLGGPRRSGTR